jgi:predicted nuclease of predicted toxin-antitoxin system
LKLLFDVNLSPALVQILVDLAPGSEHVANCSIGTDDDGIWDFARVNDFVIVSKDTDFYRMSTLLGAPPKVVWLRVGNAGTVAIASLLRASHEALLQFEQDAAAALLILSRAATLGGHP